MAGYESIDSHFSLGQNRIMFLLQTELQNRSIVAHDYPTIQNLDAYFNVVQEIFYNFLAVISEDIITKFNQIKINYRAQKCAILDGAIKPSYTNFYVLVDYTDLARCLINGYLQKNYKYFFRMTERQQRGLKNLTEMFEHNIFVTQQKTEKKEVRGVGYRGGV